MFRFVVSLAAGLLLSELLTGLLVPGIDNMGLGGAALFALFLLLGCAIGWVAAEMLVQKSFRVFKMGRSWAGLAVLWLLLTALLFGCELDVTGFEGHVPAADEVRSVTVSANGEMELRESGNIALAIELHQRLVDEKALYEATDLSLSPYGIQYVGFSYVLSDGSHLRRSYAVSSMVSTKDVDLLETLSNTPEALLSRKLPRTEPTLSTVDFAAVNWAVKKNGETTVETLELTAAEALELYNDCILPDMRDGTIGLVWLEADADYRAEVYDCCISMDLRGQDRGREEYVDYETFYTYATVFSERTNAWLAEHGIEPSTLEQLGNEYLYT